MTTKTMTVVTTSTTQSSLGLSSLIFVMKINSFVIQPNKLWTRFKKCLPYPNHDVKERCNNRACGPSYHSPNRNKQQDYNEENSEDKEYVKRILGNHLGLAKDNGRDYQEQRDYRMKVELPSFNAMSTLKGTVEDKQVCLVAYKLKGGAFAWWDHVQLNHTRE